MPTRIFRARNWYKLQQACIETIERRLLLSAGAIDPTFGIGGTVAFQEKPFQEGVGFSLQPDGSIAVPVGKQIFHLSPNGDFVDATAPVAPDQLELDAEKGASAFQSDGKLIVADGKGTSSIVVQRYNADGTLDTTYGTNGTVSLADAQFSSESPGAVAIDGQGRAVIGMGVFTPNTYSGIEAFAVTRLTSNGQIDRSFGTNGFTVAFEADDDTTCTALVIAPDGTIYQSGTLDQFQGDENSPLLAYSNTGQLIATNLNGVPESNGGLLDLALQANGEVVAAGYIDNPSSVVVDRFLPASQGLSLDGQTTFTVLSSTSSEWGNANVGWQVAIQPDGKILVGSTATNYENTYSEVTITRLTGDPVGSVSGNVYNDINSDGKRESGESGVAGQTIYADLNNTGTFQPGDPTTTTDSSGNYALAGVPQGATVIREFVQPCQRQTFPTNGYGDHVTIGETPVTGANFGVHVSPKLTGTVIGTPGSYRNHGTTTANVFDGNLSTYFDGPDASGDWAGLDLGSALVITQLSYAPRPGWESRMVGGMFQGSNSADFSSGNVTLYTVTSAPTAGVLTSVQINNASAFRYVRYIGPANGYCDIAEAEFFGGTPVVGATLYPDGTLVVNGTAGADNIDVMLGDGAGVVINGATQNFIGGVRSLVVNAGAGNDTVLVEGGGGDGDVGITVNGGDGNDSLTSLFQAPGALIYFDGGGGDDYLNVELYGSATLIGGDGNDIFASNGANESVFESVLGGDGNDTLRADGDTAYSLYDGGAGSNTIDYAYHEDSTPDDYNYILDMAGSFLVNVNNVIGGESLIGVIANDNGDTITYPFYNDSATLTVQGGAGNDTITIDDAAGAGVLVDGNGGDDNITVTQSWDVTVNGGAGDDTINVRGNESPSSVDGGPGFDTAYTNPGDTVVNVESLNPDTSTKLTGTVIGTSGSYRSHGTTITNVFDGNLSTYFDGPDASGDWAGLDLGVAKVIMQLSYAPRPGWESRMVGGMFQGSNSADFSSGDVTLYTLASVPTAGVLTTVQINNPSAFRYVRYIGPANSYCDIAEAEFFGGTPVVGATLYPDGTLEVNGTAGADNIHITLDGAFTFGSVSTAAVTINGVTQDFDAGVLNLVVNAGAGNDTVLVDGEDTSDTGGYIGVTVNGGDGDDSLSAGLLGLDSSSDNSLYLDGGGGDDYLFVQNNGNATLIGGDGNDTFDSNGTNEGLYESVYGGDGNDTLRADGDTQYSIFDGGAGSNTIDYTHSGDQGYVTVNMANGFLVNVNNLIGSQFVTQVIANDNGDTISYADAGTGVTVQGGAGNDIISINDGSGVLVDGNGDDDNITVTNSLNVTVNGGAGNDTIHVRGNTTVSVDGGPGFDTAYTDPGDTVVNVESLNPDAASQFTGTVIGTSGSYRNHGTTIANVFDGNLSTFFDAPDASGDWVGLDLGSAKVVTQVKFAPRPGWASRMVGGEIQASNTANFSSGVVTLFTINSTPLAGVLTTESLSNTSAFRYYRYIGPANSFCDIAELEFAG